MASFPADTLLRNAVDSVFSLNHNGEQLPVTRVAASSRPQVQVRGVGILRKDGMKEFQVACFQPIGSVFRFLSDDSATVGGQERAPSGLVYLSAGISFCFMTQLGR